jgi:predicted dinucleotide-binding enzyme
VAGDDAEAVAITERLVRDAGFDPVYVGPLSDGRRFDRGADVYVRGVKAAEMRQAQNL